MPTQVVLNGELAFPELVIEEFDRWFSSTEPSFATLSGGTLCFHDLPDEWVD